MIYDFEPWASNAMAMAPKWPKDFLLWALHVFHTSVFFLTCCAMAYIYGQRLSPALDAKGLTHPADRFWRSSGSWHLATSGFGAVWTAHRLMFDGFPMFFNCCS